jgi:hypothetical protein
MAMGDNSKMRAAPAVPPRRGVPVALAVVAATAAVLISGCAGSRQAGAGAAGGSSASAPGGASSGSASSGGAWSGGASSGGGSSNGATGTPGAASGGASAGAGGGSSAPAPASACATPGSYLTSIRTGQQASADRVVFQFAGKLPSYTVTPVPQVVGDGSGKPVTIAGKSFLKVTFRGASAVCPATGHATYPGPSATTPNYAQLLGLAAAGDFEGYLTWGIGLAAKGGYHAYTLTAPYRVVIDISRP